jgi:xylan 1,4-beta-xylosidase
VPAQNVPTDFISSHGYADDSTKDLFRTSEDIPMDRRVCLAIKKVHDQIAASPRPGLPLMWTEWNVPSFEPLNARDTVYVGAALGVTRSQRKTLCRRSLYDYGVKRAPIILLAVVWPVG